MSYADAAASSGPIGAEKLPTPPQVENTTNPHGNVETLPEDEFNKLRESAKKDAARAEKAAREKVGDFRKDFDEFEKNSKSYYNKFINYVKSTYNDLAKTVSANTNSDALVSLKQEFQNPVVIAQTIAGLGGLVAGYFTYLERHRIRSENKVVVATHASIITGLILADSYLFKTYYPKYDKKKNY